jgi:hypothetical protein
MCPDPSERCYPLGGRAFHLLGDERTRVNWSAPKTSYVERDSENRLRGFDDRAATTQTRDTSGRAMWTIRRDYRDLVPLLRHRYEPDHPAVVALHRQAHDVRLTIDAGLQLRVTSIVASYARKSGGRAAPSCSTGYRRAPGQRELSLAGRWNAGKRRGQRRRSLGSTAGPGEIRAVSAGFDVQAGDSGRRASQGRRSRHDHLFVRALAGRQGRRQDQGLESTDPR